METWLEVYTRETAPTDWAMNQNNLGGALETSGDRVGDKDDWRAAAACFRAALEVWTNEHDPVGHDLASRNLTRVLGKLGEP